MKISKTAFKEYAKCNRIYPLENTYLKKLETDISYFDEEDPREILSLMFDADSGADLVSKEDESFEDILKYYNQVEEYALKFASEKFGGEFIYFEDTKKQKVFSFVEGDNNFYCYLDGFLEKEDEVIIIEVKATTSKKFLKAGSKDNPLFINSNNIFHLNEAIDLNDRVFLNHYKKLFDFFSDTGKYVFDLAVERYIIEQSIKQYNLNLKEKKIKYHLAVLNADYVFDGEYKDDLITYIDLTKVTLEYLPKIHKIKEGIVKSIGSKSLPKRVFGRKCGSGTNKCIFYDVCFPELNEVGSITEYMQVRHFGPNKLTKTDLINEGKFKLDDIEESWLTNQNNLIQRDCYLNNKEYLNEFKVKKALESLEYPIYHLDFESFPCPIPRFKFEKPYSQSLFQFSVHIEKSPGVCSFVDDNYSYLARDFKDNRREFVEELIKVIDLNEGGTVLVYNKSFEYNRIKELMMIFEEYRVELGKVQAAMFDLIDILKTNKSLYMSLGFLEKESKEINFYNQNLRGGYSIKKVLPLFSDLTYTDLKITNGNEAMYSYLKFEYLLEEDLEELRADLLEYCRLDTWAMVVILNELRKRVVF